MTFEPCNYKEFENKEALNLMADDELELLTINGRDNMIYTKLTEGLTEGLCFITLTENAVTNLIYDYAHHRVNVENDEDGSCTETYGIDLVYCQAVEAWMNAIGISPQSNFVTEIINKERERRRQYGKME